MKNFPIKQIFLVAGILFVAVGLYLDHLAREFIKNSLRAKGEVIELKARPGDSWSKAPVVKFNTENDREIVFQSNNYSRPPAFEVGEKVGVLYTPDDPKASARVDTFFSTRGVPMILYILGVFFIILGVIFMFVFRK